MNRQWLVLLTLTLLLFSSGNIMAQSDYIDDEQVNAAVSQLTEMHGSSVHEHIARGVRQVAERWREGDGTPEQFAQFCTSQYIADAQQRQLTAERFEDHWMNQAVGTGISTAPLLKAAEEALDAL